MMKQRLVILMSLSALLLPGACMRSFDLEVTSSPKLFLQCCPGPGDTTILQLNRTIPVGSTYDGPVFLESADIEFRVNGVGYPVARADEKTGTVPPGGWYVAAPLRAGDAVQVEARAEGLDPVSATTVIPDEAPVFTWKCTPDSVRVTFQDELKTEDWYGLAVYCERTIVNLDNGRVESVQRGTLKPLAGYNDTWWHTVLRNYVDIPFNGWSFGYVRSLIRVWPDTGFSGRTVTLSMPVRASSMTSYVGNYAHYDCYKVQLYRVTREFFRYGVALDHVRNNEFAEASLAPAAFSFSNVSGGTGILAGWTVSETDWMTID